MHGIPPTMGAEYRSPREDFLQLDPGTMVFVTVAMVVVGLVVVVRGVVGGVGEPRDEDAE